MNTLFDKLNLRPQERRLVMVAGVVLFVVLNVWLVFPHFKDWEKAVENLRSTRQRAQVFEAESAKVPQYKQTLERLQEEGLWVVPGEQSLSLVQTVNSEAAAANVFVQKISPAPAGSSTNLFFEEQRLTMNCTAGEPELVDFLRRLGAGASLIRVRDMDLRPDPTGQKIAANLTIIGNYLKKPGAKTAPGRPGAKGVRRLPTKTENEEF